MKIIKIILFIIFINHFLFSDIEVTFEGNKYIYSVKNIGALLEKATILISTGYFQLIDKREDKIALNIIGINSIIYVSNLNPVILNYLEIGRIYNPKETIINKIEFYNKYDVLEDLIAISRSNKINDEIILVDPDKNIPADQKFIFKVYDNNNNRKKLLMELEYQPINFLYEYIDKNHNKDIIGVWKNIKNKNEFLIINNKENEIYVQYINLLNKNLNFDGIINKDKFDVMIIKSNITPFGKNINWNYEITLGEYYNLGYYLALNKVPFLPYPVEDYYIIVNDKNDLPEEIKDKFQ